MVRLFMLHKGFIMFNKILVPIDLSAPEYSKQALTIALREVQNNDTELHLITIVPSFTNVMVASYFSKKDHQRTIKELAIKFKAYVEEVMPENVVPILRVYEGSPSDSIVDYVDRKKIDLVIMASHHHSAVNHFLLGSVSARVSERAKCSVMLLRKRANIAN